MTVQEAKQKATVIYNLLKNIEGRSVHYDCTGSLNFNFSSLSSMSCRVTPKEDNTYSMLIFKQHNAYQRTILSEIDNIKAHELNDTFMRTVRHLNNEYEKYDKGTWLGYGELITTE